MNQNKQKIVLPHIGLRIIKSAVSVLCCFLFYAVFRPGGIMFYSQLSTLWCIQSQRDHTLKNAAQRTIGTVIGCLFGLLVLLVDINLIGSQSGGNFIYAILVSVCIIFVLYLTVVINRRDASYFSCVVFLSIVVNHIGDANPFLFVFDRFVDTMIGIIIAMLINNFHLPRKKQKDILFVSGMDETLLAGEEQLSPYSQVEINRMLADGANFTVSTGRTPASLIELLRNINIQLPVIAMNGAVLYDIQKNEYILSYIIPNHVAEKICTILDRFGVNYFINMLLENSLLIQHKELKNEAEKDIYQNLSTSPYRNYITKNMMAECKCIYFMIVQEKELCEQIYKELMEDEVSGHVKIMMYDSVDYEGYSYIKIYEKNTSRENMLDYLKKVTGLTKTITFGSVEGKYDVVIDKYDNNKVAQTLKKMYEPLRWKKNV